MVSQPRSAENGNDQFSHLKGLVCIWPGSAGLQRFEGNDLNIRM